MAMFQLDERLQNGLIRIGEMAGSLALMLPDSENPWCVLVPQVANIKELHQLNETQQSLLLNDMNLVSKVFEQEFKPDKINIGALGNIVPQLHIHIICRFKEDRAWPGPIWGTESKKDQKVIDERLQLLKSKLL